MNLTSNKNYQRYSNSNNNSLRNHIHSARLMSLTKSHKWLSWLIDRKVVVPTNYYSDIVHSETSRTNLKVVIAIMIEGMNSRYGSNWDVHIEEYDEDMYQIEFFTIFSDVHITNSQGLEHDIKNLVVVYPIYANENGDKFFLGRIKGTRITLSRKEYDAAYAHSHLSSGLAQSLKESPLYASDFCIGNGDLAMLEIVLKDRFNLRDFVGYLYEVDATVRWESLEGTPYMYIKNLTVERSDQISLSGRYEADFMAITTRYPLDVSFYISSNKYKIKLDDVFKQFVKNLLETKPFLENVRNNVLCTYHSATKKYFKVSSIVNNAPSIPTKKFNDETAYLIYNGEKKYTSIRANPKGATEEPQEEIIVHPTFLKRIHERLENQLHQKVTRHSAISKYHSPEYQSANITQDTVSV